MDCIASEKGDSTENCDPNSSISNGKTNSAPENNVTDRENVKVCSEESTTSSENNTKETEEVEFKIIFNKTKYDVAFDWNSTVKDLKVHLEKVIGVPRNTQKILIKGMARDDLTLKKAGVVTGGKVMVIGSKMDDIIAVTSYPQQQLLEDRAASQSSKEPLCVQKIHRKVLDKGVPPDVMPGIKGSKESLPPVPLSGMLNKHGGKVRLTFKPEQDQLWLGTKERTEKLAMNSIKNITSEPIKDHEEYHIMGLQLGPTEASRYWVYWVPAQYVEAIKDAILGKWQFF